MHGAHEFLPFTFAAMLRGENIKARVWSDKQKKCALKAEPKMVQKLKFAKIKHAQSSTA